MAFARSAAQLRFEEESPVQPEQLLIPRRNADTASDLNTVFNVVQENVVRGGIEYRGERRVGGVVRPIRSHTRPVRSVDGDVKLNRALWTLAEEMAKIKGAA